jgi:tRNA-guanine family transglycosylase
VQIRARGAPVLQRFGAAPRRPTEWGNHPQNTSIFLAFGLTVLLAQNHRHIKTAHGVIQYPAYIPVTTLGKKYPLDGLIQPYLPRLSQAVMVSYHYARQMKQRPRLPLLIDSGGFAALFEGARVVEDNGLGVLEIPATDGIADCLHPMEVLEFQEQQADIAFTLDFPIPPNMDPAEAERRQELTIANALWALSNRRRGADLCLFACIQA